MVVDKRTKPSATDSDERWPMADMTSGEMAWIAFVCAIAGGLAGFTLASLVAFAVSALFLTGLQSVGAAILAGIAVGAWSARGLALASIRKAKEFREKDRAARDAWLKKRAECN